MRQVDVDESERTGQTTGTHQTSEIAAEQSRTARQESPEGTVPLTLLLNGVRRSAPSVPPQVSLLTALREHFGLPGSKNACEQGECGSCTVYLDRVPVCSCLVAAGQAEDREVRTVEGLADNDPATPGPGVVQRAFLACGAVQCGFCTPGLIVAVDDLLRRTADPGPAVVREALAGNLCRCTGYEKILEAVAHAAAELASQPKAVAP